MGKNVLVESEGHWQSHLVSELVTWWCAPNQIALAVKHVFKYHLKIVDLAGEGHFGKMETEKFLGGVSIVSIIMKISC